MGDYGSDIARVTRILADRNDIERAHVRALERMADAFDRISDSGSITAVALAGLFEKLTKDDEPEQREPAPAEPTEGEWEYITTTGPRKAWNTLDQLPEGDGWEPDYSRGRPGEAWDRFEYHEEAYWKRLVPSEEPVEPMSESDM